MASPATPANAAATPLTLPERPSIAADATQLIGSTPLVRLDRFGPNLPGRLIAKLESLSPGYSVKDRIAVAMVEEAERRGEIQPGVTTIVEPTSGNAGIALAWVAAARGYRLILTMPESVRLERRVLLLGYGAEIVLTPGVDGMLGAVRRAERILAERPNTWMPRQFENPANPEIHRRTTALELWRDTEGTIDVLVGGVGTGGTLTGAAQALKELNPDLKVIAVEPTESPVLGGGRPGPHGIQGIGPSFIPKVLDRGVIDEISHIDTRTAIAAARELMRAEGLLVGPSSGAAAAAARQIAARSESRGRTIVVILPDSGERYLTTSLFDDLQERAAGMTVQSHS